MSLDIDKVTALLEAAAAEEIMPRFRGLAESEVRRKAGGEPVTVADEATEAFVEKGLRSLLPEATVVGEEGIARSAEGLAGVDWEPPVWIIDPIDGTANFAAGRPVFVVMVALVRNRQLAASWIHDPIAGRTAVAEAGAGAFLDGERLAAASPARPEELRGTLHTGRFGGPELDRRAQAVGPRVGKIKSLRCAGQEYIRLASGEIHYSLFTKLMPWDHAPGVLLYREAGGLAKLFDGRDYQAPIFQGPPLLMAADEDLWQSLRSMLTGDD